MSIGGPFELDGKKTVSPLSAATLDQIAKLDTCTVSNAIERLNVRLRNEGFVCGNVKCRFPQLPPMLGYAVTGVIRASSPPMTGSSYYDRMDWWQHVASIPAPRVIVIQDADPLPGVGAWIGEMHATIGRALQCVGWVTNGAVRDLAAVEALGIPLFSGSVAVSHAYAHVVEFGQPVEIGGLKIRSGDLVHGDRNGVHVIPLEIAAQIPNVANEIASEEQELIQLCNAPGFSLQILGEALSKHARRHSISDPAGGIKQYETQR